MSDDFVRTVYLHGAIGAHYGHEHRLAVGSPREAIRALHSQHPGFLAELIEGDWRVVRGDPEKGFHFGPNELAFRLGDAPLHFVPVPKGHAKKGIGKIIAGIALAVGGFLIGGPAGSALAWATKAATGIGISLALQGASMLLTKTPPAANARKAVEDRASFVFNGAENVAVQGDCIPVVVGRMRVGSIPVSVSLIAEQI